MPESMSTETILFLALYMLPAIAATLRGHQQRNAIFLLNLLLSWTVIGWIAALICAATAKPETV